VIVFFSFFLEMNLDLVVEGISGSIIASIPSIINSIGNKA